MDMGLGLNMKKIKPTDLRVCFALIVSSVLLAACMKTPELNKDFGPEVTADQLNQTLLAAQTAATSTSVNNIKLGEFAYYEKTSQIENLYPTTIKQRAETVTKAVATTVTDPASHNTTVTKIDYTITEQLVELDPATGNMKPSTSQGTACLEKVAGACSVAASASFSVPDVMSGLQTVKALASSPPVTFGANSGHLNDLSWKSFVKQTSTPDPSGIKWTYHNLVKTEGTATTPPLVSMRTNCGGRTKPCANPMHTFQVSFDEVDWTSESYPVKYSYNLIFSDEAPFFGAQLMSCGATTIPFQDQRIAILQCESIKDFTVGQ